MNRKIRNMAEKKMYTYGKYLDDMIKKVLAFIVTKIKKSPKNTLNKMCKISM